MQIKAVEIRDEGTFIAALAIRTKGVNEAETFLLKHEGFDVEGAEHIILVKLADVTSEYDPHSWHCVTLEYAHKWLQTHFQEIETGAVIDVQFLKGERKAPRTSQRFG